MAVVQLSGPGRLQHRRLLAPLLGFTLAATMTTACASTSSSGESAISTDAAEVLRESTTPTTPASDPGATSPTVTPLPSPKPIPLPTPHDPGALVGAAALRDRRPPPTATPEATAIPQPPPTSAPSTAPEPTATPEPTLAPEPAATAEPAVTSPTATPEPEIPTPDGSGALGALRTPTGVLVGIVGGAEGAWEVVSPCNNVVTVTTGEVVATPVVLIDPGHGGTETGAVGPGGLIEKDANLAVSIELERWLEDAGVSAELVRDRDYRVAIRARTALANALQPLLFVSVHHNGGSSIADHTQVPVEVFYQEFSTDSKRLAGLMHEELVSAMDPLADVWSGTPFQGAQPRFNSEGGTLYGILRRSNVPTVITEAFYVDNAPGEALLRDQAVVETEAAALGVAIQRFLTTADPGSGFVEGQSFTLGNNSGGTDGCVDPALE